MDAYVKAKETTGVSDFEVWPCKSEQDQRIAYW